MEIPVISGGSGLSKTAKETGSKTRQDLPGPFEYTLYLEEDCPGKVVYYVFVIAPRRNPASGWSGARCFIKARRSEEYGAVGALLEKAAQSGFPVDAELRFIEIGGDLISKKPEDFLTGDLKIRPDIRPQAGQAYHQMMLWIARAKVN